MDKQGKKNIVHRKRQVSATSKFPVKLWFAIIFLIASMFFMYHLAFDEYLADERVREDILRIIPYEILFFLLIFSPILYLKIKNIASSSKAKK